MNLLDVLKSQLASGNTMDVISNLLGENKTATSSGLNAILPTLLGSLIQKGSTTEGAGNLLNIIKTGGHDGSVLNNIGSLLGGGEKTSNFLNSGSGLLNTLLGDKLGGVASIITGLSGLKSGSTSSLLQLAAPLVMGLVGKHSAGKSASGLSSMLLSQSDFVKAALPSGVSSLLGLSSLSSPSSSTSTSSSDEGSGFSKLLPWLIGAAVLAGVLMAWRACKSDPVTTATTVVDNAAKTATDAATATTGAVADAATKVGEALKVALPGGVNLDVPKGSLEDKIVTFIQSKDTVSKTLWFDFDRLTFETGKAVLKPESETQLKNAVAIMQAFPKVKIKIGGYTDNVGKPESNLKLSGDRAKNVMAEMVKRGVAAARMSAEGYGDKNPVASNDTEAGKAQNRRISISVREK